MNHGTLGALAVHGKEQVPHDTPPVLLGDEKNSRFHVG
jgi:hypothetical protein